MLLEIAGILVSVGSPVPDATPVADAVFGHDDILVSGAIPRLCWSYDGGSYHEFERELRLHLQKPLS